MINWKVRAKNRLFWLAIIPAILLLIQTVATVFGFNVDFTGLGDKLTAIVNAVFTVLAVLGIVADPTTDGIGDSKLAMTYEKPKVDK